MKLDLGRRSFRQPDGALPLRPFHTRVLALLLLPLLLTGSIPVVAQPMANPAPPPQASQAFQAEAQTSAMAGRTIESIEFRGLQALSEETVLYYLGVEPGQTLDEVQLNNNLQELWGRSLVDDIEVEAVPSGEAVKLVITIQERPVLRSIDYQGLKRISKTDIQDKLSGQRIQAREGEPMSLGELQRVKTLIEEMYAEKGYRFAQARYTVEDVGPNEKRVIFSVDEGNRVRIADIQFEGNEVFSDMRLQLAMKKVKESGLISRMMKKDIYDPAKLQEDLDKVHDVYRAAGYKNAVIGEPRIEVRALKPDAANVKDQKRRMFVIVPIEEGDRWKLGEVTIEGNETYSDQQLLRAFQTRPNSWLRAKLIDEGVKAISDTYHNTGYIYANVEPELVEKEGKVADLVVHVQEGEQFKVGRIEFEGNERTMDKVLRRELRLYEGGVVNVGAVRNSVLKIKQLGYFNLNEEDPVEIEPDVERKVVDLLFKGKEADRTELQFGGGWSELDGFFGQFAVNTKNFLGRGEQVGVSYQSGRYRDFFDLSYYIPWFLDRPQSIGVRAFNQDLNYNLFDATQRLQRSSRGGILTYGRNFRLFQSASISYNRSRYEDTERIIIPDTGVPPGPDDPKPGDILEFISEIDSSSLRPLYVIDSRDHPFEPTRGQRLSVGVEYAGGFLGGETYFIRPELAYSTFIPVSNYPTQTVFALNVEGGLVDPFGGRELPTLERFYLGGENSIRGHRFRSLFLRKPNGDPVLDPDTGVILGGDSFMQINLEYHFLLGGPFRLIMFGDAGNVFGEEQSFDLSNLRYTAGAELRILLPVFGAPLRFIYAVNLDEKPKDSFEDFQFSIGTSF
ncbi:MAG TPA: outer membrane protein assembly factor BamA [Thermoanaerobaculia bacterium]|nr:outer membrane protein assembly factor BamA [Thermoanaerobaculia bacterium]